MIPKYIHYCWFGRGEKNALFYKCMASWKKFFPDYQIIEWNEDNYNIGRNLYVQQAYESKKYAFVSDYVRIQALVEYGGIYFDTDYEVIKDMTELLNTGDLISGFESERSLITAFIATNKANPTLIRFLDSYRDRSFIDSDGNMDLTPINQGFSKLLEENGIDLSKDSYQITKDNLVIYPTEYLCGFDVKNWHERITNNTYGVHHMGNSWANPEMKRHIKRIRFIQRIIGIKAYDFLKSRIKE